MSDSKIPCVVFEQITLFVRGPSIGHKLGRSGSSLFSVRLFQERFCVGSRSPNPVQRYDVFGVIAHRSIPTDSRRRNSSAFSVILGLNCSVSGSITRANLVNQTEPVRPTNVR